jgi:hypothetical protein
MNAMTPKLSTRHVTIRETHNAYGRDVLQSSFTVESCRCRRCRNSATLFHTLPTQATEKFYTLFMPTTLKLHTNVTARQRITL